MEPFAQQYFKYLQIVVLFGTGTTQYFCLNLQKNSSCNNYIQCMCYMKPE